MKTKNILFSYLLIIVLSINITAQTATVPEGTGTEADPYKIASLDNLFWLSQQLIVDGTLDKFYKQTANINAAVTKSWDSGAGFNPIAGFTGIYDGRGYVIDSLVINRTGNAGLFGVISSASAVIKGLGLTNVDVLGSDYVGALVSKLYYGTVKECYSSGMVESSGSSAGGLLGGTRYGALIESCYSSATVKVSQYRGGGLIGYVRDKTPGSIIKNCYTSGKVINTTSDDAYTGGLIGTLISGTVENSYSRAVVSVPSSTSLVGGLVGYSVVQDASTNSFWDVEVSGQSASAIGIGKTTTEMKDYATYTDTTKVGLSVAWDFVTNPNHDTASVDVWDIDQDYTSYPILSWEDLADDAIEAPAIYPVVCEGDGSESNPYKISTIENLVWLSKQKATAGVKDKHFIQTADIDANKTKDLNNGEGFKPVSAFTGTYDGKGYSIDGLFINRGPNVGLFSLVSNADVVIKNLGLTNVDITGSTYVGALVGKFYRATVSNCYSSGKVESSAGEVGGLIGGSRYGALIESSYSSADVKGAKYKVGGLIGYIRNKTPGTIVKNCYSSGSVSNVTSEDNAYTGGLVGSLESGTVENSYSRAVVTSTATTLLGGLVGYAASVEVATNSFWDTEVSGLSESIGGIGKTTTEMKDYATYTDTTKVGLSVAWDFVTNPNHDTANVDVWDIDQSGNGYPILSWEENADDSLVTSLEGVDRTQLPVSFALEQNYPNPFNPTTTISFALPRQVDVNLSVYNILGEKITELINGNLNAGNHKVNFDASNFASGLYIYKISAGNFISVKKMMLLK